MNTEAKSYFTIAFGCTGGRHRSVYIVEQVAVCLFSMGFQTRVRHRELVEDQSPLSLDGINLMGQTVSSGMARGEARYGLSGKPRNTAGGAVWPTAGRVSLRRDFAPRLNRCTTSHGGGRRVTAQGIPGQMVQSKDKGL